MTALFNNGNPSNPGSYHNSKIVLVIKKESPVRGVKRLVGRVLSRWGSAAGWWF